MTTTNLVFLLVSVTAALAAFAWFHAKLGRATDRAETLRTEHEAAKRELAALRASAAALADQVSNVTRSKELLEAALREEQQAARTQLEAVRLAATQTLDATREAKSAVDAEVASLTSALKAQDRLVDETKSAVRLARDEQEKVQRASDAFRRELGTAQEQLAARDQQVRHLQQQVNELEVVRAKVDHLHAALTESAELGATLRTELEAERRASEDKLHSLTQSQTQLEDRFKGIAAQILERNSEKFESNTKLKLNELSDTFGKHVKALQEKVEHTHDHDLKDRIALRTELQNMVAATKRVDQDATNLTRALTGDRKTQGAWGELVLSRILEQCGLREGVEYEKQVTFKDENDKRLRPDVLVRLPGARSIVVDAKVSLTAYNEYASAASDEEAAEAIERHLCSVRSHIKDLSSKDYWSLNGLHATDYVLMFLPIESAFADALRNDPSLFELAFQEHIILTSPSTLLATLRTIDHTWRIERQNETARAIVEEAGKLYDRFVAFADEMAKVGSRLRQAQNAYDDASAKLSTGHGNLVRRVEKIRKLGVKVKKVLAAELTESAEFGVADGDQETNMAMVPANAIDFALEGEAVNADAAE